MKRYLLAALVAATTTSALACTNLLVGKKASTNGATLISYNADSHTLYGTMQFTPAATHAPGAMRPVYDWDSNRYLGEIPQPAQTYRTVGNQNEWQVSIAESTWGGDLSLMDSTAVIDYGSLIYIALERSKTAREAIDIMTQLVEVYGYASEGETFSIADPEEVWVMDLIGKGPDNKGAIWVAQRIPDDCISAHANQARIHRFPQQGRKLKKVKSLLPQDLTTSQPQDLTTSKPHNLKTSQPQDLKTSQPQNLKTPQPHNPTTFSRYEVGDSCLFAADLISFSRERGLWSGSDADFDFAACYGDQDYTAYRGCDGRVWAYFNRYADGMDKYFPFVDMQCSRFAPVDSILPLYVKPNRKLSHRDIQDCLGDHFEGTVWDMTQDVGSGPFHSPYRWRPMTWKAVDPATGDTCKYMHERAIGTQQTGFTFVAEMRSWLPREVGAITWFGTDDAGTAFYAPIYNNVLESPLCFREGNGSMLEFSWTSAFWMTNWVAQQCYTRYEDMIKDVNRVRYGMADRWDAEQDSIDAEAVRLLNTRGSSACTAFLNEYSAREANGATASYKDLALYLLVKYLDGNIKQEEAPGQFTTTPEGLPAWPKQPRYSDDFYQSIVNQRGAAIKVKGN